jgi:hypothetical protein
MSAVIEHDLTPHMMHALATACETDGVQTNGNTANALMRRGLVVARPSPLGNGTSIKPTADGRAFIDALGGPRAARRAAYSAT